MSRLTSRPRLVPVALLAAAMLLCPAEAAGKSSASAGKGTTAAPPSARTREAAAAKARAPSPALQKARAELATVKKSPAKRRYRHNWEKAIGSLERAAKGPDTGPALLDAARARYALYRFSAVEADREKALALAGRASRAGAAQAGTLATAIRREAGDDPPPSVAKAPPRKGTPATAPALPRRQASPPVAAPPSPAPAVATAAAASAADETEEELDPVLEEAVAETAPAPIALPEKGAPAAPAPAHVSEVQTWSNADYTRVAVYLSQPVGFEKQELPADGDHPRRLALDVRPALLDGQGSLKTVGDSLLHRVRVAQHGPDTVRVVLDLKGQEAYQVFTLGDPPRLIVDLGVREAQREAIARAVPRAAPEEEDAESGRRPIRRIIVDAGHGGHDTGAIGPRGVREKDVTLAMARRLAEMLGAQGFQVTLTRTDDRYLKL
jgi:N-acetylmuramoyl-L-alanine amidase